MNGFLEVAAYCSLVVAMGLLLVRLFWPKLAPRIHVRRFRHRLGSVDGVVVAWAAELEAQDRGKRHEERHPEPTDD